MGQKVNPIGMRLGIVKSWQSRWYAEGEKYIDQLHQDIKIREIIKKSGHSCNFKELSDEEFLL